MKAHNLVEMLAQTVKTYPDKTALKWKEDRVYREMSYQQCWNTIRDFAFGLERLGIRSGIKVAILSENNPRWLISDFAILSLGATVVPIYPTLTGKQITYILEDADVEAIIVQTPKLLARIEEFPSSTKHIILMTGTANDDQKALQFETVIQMGQTVAIEDYDWAYPSIQSSDLATIIYTSGTTGNPKGVMLSHSNLLTNVESASHYAPYVSSDVLLSILPLSHAFERTGGHFTPLYAGATIAYCEGLNKIAQNIQEVRPTVILSVPRLFEKLYNRILAGTQRSSFKKRLFDLAFRMAEEKYALSSTAFNWSVPKKMKLKHALAEHFILSKVHEQLGGRIRFMVSGGAALDVKISRFFGVLGIPILEGYGMSECAPIIAFNRLIQVKPGTVGKALPGTELRLLPDGELLVRSGSVMLGYYKQPEETAQTIVNGWLYTGDIAEIDDEGYVRIVDRKKNIIVLSTGKNVAPQPIETTLLLSPYIHQIVIIGNNRKFITALIVPDYIACFVYMKEQQRPITDRAELVRTPEITKLIKKEITLLLKDFAPFEQPKRFTLLSEEFTIEKDELTPTLKVRTTVVEKNYADLIQAMYGEGDE